MAGIFRHPGPQGEFLGFYDGRGGRWFRSEAHVSRRLYPGFTALIVMNERDSQALGRYDKQERLAAVAKAERWTDRQAWRLNTNSDYILEALRERAWLPEQIEGVSSKYALENHPPPLEGVEPWMGRKPKIRCAA